MRLRQTGLANIAHDPEAFDVFYRRHFDAVTRFLARRAEDPRIVADLTAEVFLAVLDSAHTYRPDRGSEIAWLYGGARNDGRNEVKSIFDEKLLAELKMEIAARAPRGHASTSARFAGHRFAWAGAGIATIATATAVAVPLTIGGDPPEERHHDLSPAHHTRPDRDDRSHGEPGGTHRHGASGWPPRCPTSPVVSCSTPPPRR